MRVLGAKLILAVIPAALFCLSVVLTAIHGPDYLRNNFDPDYNYLLNSLSLLRLHSPAHTDHPGTTLQILGAVIILIQWLGGVLLHHGKPLSESVLSHPEEYLRGINLVLNGLISGALYWAACRIYRLSNSLAAAMVLQLTVLVYLQIDLALMRVSPEPLLIAAGLALIVPVAPMVLPAKCTEANANRRAAIAGAIFGFGLITKITFAPLAAVVLLLPEKSRKRRFVVAAALASLLLLLPVIPRIPAMASWFTSLLVHTGTYGGGRIGIPQKSELAANFLVLLRDEPPLFWFLSLYLGVLLLPGIRDMARPLLLTAFLAIGAEILMVVKHPGTHYLVPVLVLTAFVNSALCVMLLRAEPRNSAWRQFYLALIVASIGVGLVHNWGSLRWWMDAARMDRRNISEMQTLETKLIGCQIIGSYRSSLELYALAFASDYSGGVHRNTLEKLYPGTIHYDPFGGRFLSFAFAEKSEEIERLVLSGQCVLIESTPLDADALDRFRVKNHIHLATLTIAANPVSPTEPTALYRLDLTGSR